MTTIILVPNLLSLFEEKTASLWKNFYCIQLSLNFVSRSIKNNTLWTQNIQWKCRLNTNLTHVFSAISPSRWPKISKRTCFGIVERSPTIATSAATQPSVLLSWKATCWFTVERSLSFANSATIPAQQLVTSRDTGWPIQAKSLSAAHSATIPAHKQLLSKHTC